METRVENMLLVIVGQTASGKTSLAIELAKQFDGEIICADSRTIYCEANIGTAKPSIVEQKKIRHHLLDVESIDESFTVADFKHLADIAIADVSARGKLPILVGGSGLYINAVIYNYRFRDIQDGSAREDFKDASVEELQSELVSRNIALPENSRNRRYLIRSIEAGDQAVINNKIRDNTLIIGLEIADDDLRNRIKMRTEQMFRDGLIDETIRLNRKYGWDNRAMKAPAYTAVREYVEGRHTMHEAIEHCIKLDLKLAKKQRTWFKRNEHIQWIAASKAQAVVQEFVSKTHKNISN